MTKLNKVHVYVFCPFNSVKIHYIDYILALKMYAYVYMNKYTIFLTLQVKAHRDLNLVKASDEILYYSSFSIHLARQLFLGIPPFISDPEYLCVLLDLLFV